MRGGCIFCVTFPALALAYLFEHVNEFLARDICNGLSYLHDSENVHRDLKPDNVLVSYQHYINGNGLLKHWKTKPVVAKLTDFDAIGSELIQTADLCTQGHQMFTGGHLFLWHQN